MVYRPEAGKKVLLMGRSGAGKSSMRVIIFSNHTAAQTRKLHATIEVDATPISFLGEFALTLLDCGGQDSYMNSYLPSPSSRHGQILSRVGGLLYIFDVESPDFSGLDMMWFGQIVSSILDRMGSQAELTAFHVHILIHKMDLVPDESKSAVFEAKSAEVRAKLEEVAKGRLSPSQSHFYATSIWNQSIYKAWSEIVQTLIPQISLFQTPLEKFARFTSACEVIVFENATSLVVARYSELIAPSPAPNSAASEADDGGRRGRPGRKASDVGFAPKDHANVLEDERRFEKVSALVKAFKSSSGKSGTPFRAMDIAHPMYTAVFSPFTETTSILVVATDRNVYPAALHLNIGLARPRFEQLPGLAPRGR